MYSVETNRADVITKSVVRSLTFGQAIQLYNDKVETYKDTSVFTEIVVWRIEPTGDNASREQVRRARFG